MKRSARSVEANATRLLELNVKVESVPSFELGFMEKFRIKLWTFIVLALALSE